MAGGHSRRFVAIVVACLLIGGPQAAEVARVHQMPDTLLQDRMSVEDLLRDKRYWPPVCKGSTCTLTGLGGLVDMWESHVRLRHREGKSFVVRGKCMSACYLAYKEAVRIGAAIRLAPGAQLYAHTPYAAVKG
jgi:hypothetical protein